MLANDLPTWAKLIFMAVGALIGIPLAFLQFWDQPVGLRKRVEFWHHRTLVRTLHDRGISQTAGELGITLTGNHFVMPAA